jgi:hypothetical protein
MRAAGATSARAGMQGRLERAGMRCWRGCPQARTRGARGRGRIQVGVNVSRSRKKKSSESVRAAGRPGPTDSVAFTFCTPISQRD